MIKTYYFARLIQKIHIPSFKKCSIDPKAKVASGASLTKVKLGRYSYVGSYTHITDAEIGGFCSIGGHCGIGGGMHPTEMVSTSPVFLQGRNIFRKNFSSIPYTPHKKVIIGNDVWIGEYAYIKPGIVIGDGAIVGAHAVVTHDVDPYTIVGGIPANIIRKRFDEKTIRQLLAMKWWLWSEKELEERAVDFNCPENILK